MTKKKAGMSRYKYMLNSIARKKFQISKELIAIIVMAAFLALLSVFASPVLLVSVVAAFLALIFFIKNINIGLYLIALLYPFIYLQIFIGKDINVPYVDMLAMFVFVAFVAREIWFYYKNPSQKINITEKLPGIGLFLLFIGASWLSLLNVDNLMLGIKYVLRPLTFFYLMFVILPYNLINSKKELFRVFWVLFGVGMIASLMGLFSLIFPGDPSFFRRAVPVSIFGVYPLGYNHNLIAEVLVSIIPIGFILIAFQKDARIKRFLIFSVFFMMLINLLTFSRAGWLGLFIELAVLLILKYGKRIKEVPNLKFIIASVVLIPVLYLSVFSLSSVSKSSNQNRMELTSIAFDAFKAHPVIGNGAGVFMEKVAQTKSYVLDYGAPSESHGVVQKLMMESGTLGMLTFFALLGYILVRLVKSYILAKDPQWKFIMLAVLVCALGSISFQFFNTSYFVSKLWFILGVCLAAGKIMENEIKKIEN